MGGGGRSYGYVLWWWLKNVMGGWEEEGREYIGRVKNGRIMENVRGGNIGKEKGFEVICVEYKDGV